MIVLITDNIIYWFKASIELHRRLPSHIDRAQTLAENTNMAILSSISQICVMSQMQFKRLHQKYEFEYLYQHSLLNYLSHNHSIVCSNVFNTLFVSRSLTTQTIFPGANSTSVLVYLVQLFRCESYPIVLLLVTSLVQHIDKLAQMWCRTCTNFIWRLVCGAVILQLFGFVDCHDL
ncbi:Hypothetical_protein [Hexamita inflata]|uniref:Hypothetical_protein n=1 Tax=Hexamita inflata TaxID=28002 RepID=A0AA86NH93_9EUKA|nr:Hypothetical protein HINF_LOCUS6800 [Hexamita inflata]